MSLYIHFPWCVQKCPYCDFNSHTLKANINQNEYIDALLCDLKADLAYVSDRPIQSIFCGGGTPSLFNAQSLEKLFRGLQTHLTFAPNIEITLEANPGTAEAQRFKDYALLGINRLSLGIQSFNDDHLQRLGRIHNSDEAKRAIVYALNAGFNQVNLDIMFGLPQQTASQAMTDLETALSFRTTHFSWYQLTLEPNTVFYKHPPALPADEAIWEIEKAGKQVLQANGLEQYEISAYCQQGLVCQHNLNYWLFGDYLGIGAGAHSKLSCQLSNSITRLRKVKMPQSYLSAECFVAEKNVLSDHDLLLEFMLNACRLSQKIPLQTFVDHTGLPIESLENFLQKAKALELITLNEQTFQMTAHGHRYLNELLAQLV